MDEDLSIVISGRKQYYRNGRGKHANSSARYVKYGISAGRLK